MDKNKNESFRYGQLPEHGMLASAYVPIQRSVMPSYESIEAISRGTLFPGLDLPFMNIVNDNLKPGPLAEIMAIDFVADELELYLDTHADDEEAFNMYQAFLTLQKEAHDRYVRRFGPIQQCDMMGSDRYTWTADPWPWDYQPKTEG